MTIIPTGNADYPYQIASGRALRFVTTGLGLPDFEAVTLNGERVAKHIEGVLRIGHPYAWNGCTGLPPCWETQATKEASCLHDFLYQYHQNNPALGLDRKEVDELFLRYCPPFYQPIFRAALALFGGAAWNKRKKSLIIKAI